MLGKMRFVITIICLLCLLDVQSQQDGTVILADYGFYSLDFTDLQNIKWNLDRRYTVLIKDEDDLNLLRVISVEIDKGSNEKLVGAEIKVRSPGGRRTTYTKDVFVLQPFDAYIEDYICHIPQLSVNDTLEVSYTTQFDLSSDIVRYDVQQSFDVKESIFGFLIPEAAVYHDHLTSSKYLTKEESIDSNIVIKKSKVPLKGLKMTFSDLPALTSEPFSPSLVESQIAVLLMISDLFAGTFEVYMPSFADQITDLSVNEYFGKQYRNRTYYRWLVQDAKDILETKYSKMLMVLKLYEFVHRRFAWDGSYGLFPSHTIREMQVETRVNKASMNMALLALLNEAGYRAMPILVSTTDQAPVYKEIPNINQFNHFVIATSVDNKVVYIDAGDPLLPLGIVDRGVRRNNAVLIRNYRGSWAELPEVLSKSTILVDLEVHSDLSASGTISTRFEGYDAYNERHALLADSSGQYWKDRCLSLSREIRIDSVRYNHVRNLLQPFENEIYFHIDPSADQDELSLYPVFYSFFNGIYFVDSTRYAPVHFPSKIEEYGVMNITMADDLKVLSLPETEKLRTQNNAGSLEFQSTGTENKLQIKYDIKLNSASIPTAGYTVLRAYLGNVYRKTEQSLVIGKE